MPQTTIAVIVFLTVALCAATIAFFTMRSKVDKMCQLCESMRTKWAQTHAICEKLETVALWFLDRKNMTLENTGSWVTPWLVVGKEKPDEKKLSEAWAEMYAHREEIIEALYNANLKALRTFAADKENNFDEIDFTKTGNPVKPEKALRRKTRERA